MRLRALRSVLALAMLGGSFSRAAVESSSPTLENAILRITLSPQDASLSVTDKRIGVVWRQQVRPDFRVVPDSLRVSQSSIFAKVLGEGETYAVTLTLDAASPHAFELALEISDRRYTSLPAYPFPFTAPDKNWFYVQNTTGEGMLMPLNKAANIYKPFGWSGGQPWWGLTDLKRAISVRLDTFRNADAHSGADDLTLYAVPLRLHYAFFTEGGYVALAKEYREYFLRSHPNLEPLSKRVSARPAISSLKDGVYLYLWGASPSEDLALVSEMKAAGIDRGIAVFYGKHPIDLALFDGIKHLGWIAGLYHMPTGNLFRVSPHRGWPNALLTGKLTPAQVLGNANPRVWDRICAKHLLPEWLEKARLLIRDYGTQLFYFDTLVAQLAPCLSPDHPSTIEENQQARLELMQKTRELGMIVGSGEGVCPTWALPGVDFFEGLMSLRTYTDSRLRIPAGEYETDLGNSYRDEAAIILDETRRIPLYQLAFHDYVAGTWVWRDTNFQSIAFARKKDLFNILYGTMPMWHINRRLWERHKSDFVASYRAITSVRARIGFAGMVNHGWLTADRSVQYTDWDTGDRVTVNFGERPFERAGKAPLAGASFVLERTEGK
jgi:Glycosyl hydrolases related to GH101 family, GH129